ncbi:hypothetical protein JCM3774_006358 [Rhodotorula dairenensis]
MANKDDNKPGASSALAALPLHVPNKPTPLPVASHLRGLDNCDVWTIQLRALVGVDACKIIDGEPREDGVIHHVAGCKRTVAAYWTALRDVYRPTDAQGAQRLLTRFWGLTLPAATPEAFETFSKEHRAALAAIKAADVKLETVYSSHLLNALPPALGAFQTSLAITDSSELPSTDRILDLVRNEVLRLSSAASLSTSVALTASSELPPPSPCPACKGAHWLRDCTSPEGDKFRAQRKERNFKNRLKAKARLAQAGEANAQLASLLDEDTGVKVWLTTSFSKTPRSLKPTIDSGATHSMCGEISLFFDLRRCCPSPVGGVSGAKNGLVVTGVGSLLVKLIGGRIVVIHQALLVPEIAANLVLSSQLYDNHGITTTFGQGATLSRNGVVIATGTRLRMHLYQRDGELIAPSTAEGAIALLAGTASKPELTTWHCRFAHLSLRSLKSLARSDHVKGLEGATQGSGEPCPCNTCHLLHASRLQFPRADRQTTELLELVHTDVLSINVPSYGGRRYIVTFINDHSRMLWVEALAHKSDVFGAFQRFKAAAGNESGKHIQRLRSDNGGEYTSHEFRDFLPKHGIRHEMPPPYSPQANGVAERINRTMVEGLNRSPHAALTGGVPLAVWRGKPVRVDMLRVRGCRAYHAITNGRAKLDDKAVPLVFIGYDGNTTAYRLFDPATRKTVRSRDVRFVEDEFPFASATPGTVQSPPQPSSAPDELVILASSQAPSAANDAPPKTPVRAPPVVPRPPVRAAQAREVVVTPPPPPVFARATAPSPPSPEPVLPDDKSHDEIDFLGNDPFGATLAEVEALYSAAGGDLSASDEQFSLPTSDPCNHREAMRDTDSERWRLGEHDEFASLQNEYNVFHPVDRSKVPPDAKILGTRFVYRRKEDQNGQVTGHKVRLVAQGFTPRPNVNFRETFAPVVKFTSIRVLLTRHRLHVHQADVDKAYLHGALEEELYMRVPEGIDGSAYAGKVLKLDRALYGLKQAGRIWNHRIHATLEGLGYQRTEEDLAVAFAAVDAFQYAHVQLLIESFTTSAPS